MYFCGEPAPEFHNSASGIELVAASRQNQHFRDLTLLA